MLRCALMTTWWLSNMPGICWDSHASLVHSGESTTSVVYTLLCPSCFHRTSRSWYVLVLIPNSFSTACIHPFFLLHIQILVYLFLISFLHCSLHSSCFHHLFRSFCLFICPCFLSSFTTGVHPVFITHLKFGICCSSTTALIIWRAKIWCVTTLLI